MQCSCQILCSLLAGPEASEPHFRSQQQLLLKTERTNEQEKEKEPDAGRENYARLSSLTKAGLVGNRPAFSLERATLECRKREKKRASVRRDPEESLDQLAIHEAVIDSKHMEPRISTHSHCGRRKTETAE